MNNDFDSPGLKESAKSPASTARRISTYDAISLFRAVFELMVTSEGRI